MRIISPRRSMCRFLTIRAKRGVIDKQTHRERDNHKGHGLPADRLDKLVEDARERVSADLRAPDLRWVGRHAQLPGLAGGGHGGDAQVRRAVVGVPLSVAEGDFVVGLGNGVLLGFGDVGADGGDEGVDEVDDDGDEERVQEELCVVGKQVREVGARLDAAEQRAKPALGGRRGFMALTLGARLALGTAVGVPAVAAPMGQENRVTLNAAALAHFLHDGVGVFATSKVAAAWAAAEGAEAVPSEDGLLIDFGGCEGGHCFAGASFRGVFCVAEVCRGGLCTGCFGEQVDVKGLPRSGEGGVAEGCCSVCWGGEEWGLWEWRELGGRFEAS